MKQHGQILWAFGAALSLLLAGCQKSGMTGRGIRFTAESRPESPTRAQYSGSVTNNLERIDWEQGDQILLYSPEAAVPDTDPAVHSVTYAVTSDIVPNGARSQAKIEARTSGGGLAWTDRGSSPYSFYGIFPAPSQGSFTIGSGSGTPVLSFNGEIRSTQRGVLDGDHNIVNTQEPMYMTAYASGVTESENGVSLSFDPAFTAFHINAGVDVTMTLMAVGLTAASNPVAGPFTGAFDSSNGWEYTPASTGTSTSVRLPLGGSGIELDPGEELDMVLLAMPTDLSGLTLYFDVQIAGVSKRRTLELKTLTPVELYGQPVEEGGWITFNACHKAYLKGLIVPQYVWSVDGTKSFVMTEEVQPWSYEENGYDYGRSPVINASKLEGNNPYSFSVYAPLSGSGAGGTQYKWMVSVLDGSGDPVTSGITLIQLDSQNQDTENVSVSGVLSGAQPSDEANVLPVKFRVAAAEGVTGTYFLSFSIQQYDGQTPGPVFSINSEVARSEEGYEITL